MHGHLIVSDSKSSVVRHGVFFNRTPEKSLVLVGKEGKKGAVGDRTSVTEPCLDCPAGLAIWRHGGAEDLLVCDAGAQRLVCVTKVGNLNLSNRDVKPIGVNQLEID